MNEESCIYERDLNTYMIYIQVKEVFLSFFLKNKVKGYSLFDRDLFYMY